MINLPPSRSKPASDKNIMALLVLFFATSYLILAWMHIRVQPIPYYWFLALALRGVCYLLILGGMLQELWPYLRAKPFISTFKIMEPRINKRFRKALLHKNVITFALFTSCSYMVPIFMHSIGQPDHYNWLLNFRIIGALLCTGLLLKSKWPDSLQRYIAVFFDLTLLFCLPFMITFLFLSEGDTTEFILNVLFTVILLSILVEGIKFVVISTLGIALAMGFYRLEIGPLNLSMDLKTIELLLHAVPMLILMALNHRAALHAKYAYLPQLSVWVEGSQYYLEENPEIYLTKIEGMYNTRAIAYLLTEKKQEGGQELLDTLISLNPDREEVILTTARELVERHQQSKQRIIDIKAYYERIFKELQEAA